VIELAGHASGYVVLFSWKSIVKVDIIYWTEAKSTWGHILQTFPKGF